MLPTGNIIKVFSQESIALQRKLCRYACSAEEAIRVLIIIIASNDINFGRTQFMRPGYLRSRDESNRSGVGTNFKSNTIGNHGDRLFFRYVRIPPI